jgi:hypothetical protein
MGKQTGASRQGNGENGFWKSASQHAGAGYWNADRLTWNSADENGLFAIKKAFLRNTVARL